MYSLAEFVIRICPPFYDKLEINALSNGVFIGGYLIDNIWFCYSDMSQPPKYNLYKFKRRNVSIIQTRTGDLIFSIKKSKYIIFYHFNAAFDAEILYLLNCSIGYPIHPILNIILRETSQH